MQLCSYRIGFQIGRFTAVEETLLTRLSVKETAQSKAVLHAFGSLKKRMIGMSFLICKQLLLNKARLFLWINVNNTIMTIRIGMMILEPKLFTGSVPVQALSKILKYE